MLGRTYVDHRVIAGGQLMRCSICACSALGKFIHQTLPIAKCDQARRSSLRSADKVTVNASRMRNHWAVDSGAPACQGRLHLSSRHLPKSLLMMFPRQRENMPRHQGRPWPVNITSESQYHICSRTPDTLVSHCALTLHRLNEVRLILWWFSNTLASLSAEATFCAAIMKASHAP